MTTADTGHDTDTAAPDDRPSGRRRPRHRLRLVVVGVLLAGAVGFLLAEGLSNTLDYFDTVNQALAQRATLGTTTFRLEGTVVAGSVRHTAVGADFSMSSGAPGAKSISIVNTGSPPQLFQAGVPVVVVGHFTSVDSDVFASNQILVKHSASYVAEYPTRVKPRDGAKK